MSFTARHTRYHIIELLPSALVQGHFHRRVQSNTKVSALNKALPDIVERFHLDPDADISIDWVNTDPSDKYQRFMWAFVKARTEEDDPIILKFHVRYGGTGPRQAADVVQ